MLWLSTSITSIPSKFKTSFLLCGKWKLCLKIFESLEKSRHVSKKEKKLKWWSEDEKFRMKLASMRLGRWESKEKSVKNSLFKAPKQQDYSNFDFRGAHTVVRCNYMLRCGRECLELKIICCVFIFQCPRVALTPIHAQHSWIFSCTIAMFYDSHIRSWALNTLFFKEFFWCTNLCCNQPTLDM